MIEHLRKYTGLIIIVVALLFVGLAFFGDNANLGQSNRNDPPVLSVDGTTYTYSDLQKASSARRLTMSLFLMEMLQATDAFSMGDDAQADQRFLVNRLIIKQARDEFGIHPSDQEVADSRSSIRIFSNPTTGTFDQETYNNVVKNLGSLGMTEQDMLELLRDNLAVRKLSAIVGGGLAADPKLAAEQTASNDQQVSIQLARVPLSKFQESIKPTDEELKAAWETTKDKYQTERRVKVSHVIVKPKYPEPAKEEAPKLPDAVTEEAKKAAEKEAADKKAKEEAELAVEKRKVDTALADLVDIFIDDLDKSEGADFEKLATDNGWPFATTGMFARTAVPPELSMNLRSSSNPRPVADLIFNLKLGGEPMTRFTDALLIPDGGYLIARLDEEEPVREKTFEEAKEEVRTDFIAKASGEALKKDADEKAAKIREALAAGKSFTDIAKELGLEPKAHGPFKATDKLEGEADVTTLFQTASLVDPGSLADPVLRPDGSLFVFVEKREIVEDPARAARVQAATENMGRSLQRDAFSAWIKDKFDSTRIEQLSAP